MIAVRVPVWLVWVVVGFGVGGVVGAAAHRYGPYAQLQEVAVEKERQLTETRRKLEATAGELERAKREVARRGQELVATRERLRRSEHERRIAAEEAARQRGIVLSRERDIYVLRTCLAGVAQSMVQVLEERYEDAAYALRTVERECRAASRLLE